MTPGLGTTGAGGELAIADKIGFVVVSSVTGGTGVGSMSMTGDDAPAATQEGTARGVRG